MTTLNIFDSLEHLEPKCPICREVIDYGVSTFFDEKLLTHVCKCGAELK